MSFDKCLCLCNQCSQGDRKHLPHPLQIFLCPLSSQYFTTPCRGNSYSDFYHHMSVWPLTQCHVDGIKWWVLFCIWFLSLCKMILGFNQCLSLGCCVETAKAGSLKKDIYFLQFRRLEVWDQGANTVKFTWELSSWLVDGHLLAGSLHGRESAVSISDVSSHKGTNPSWGIPPYGLITSR